jgi:Cdc6-like AAA superfamily ATPase
MEWIVIGEDKGMIKLVSKRQGKKEGYGMLPKGSYLTIDQAEANCKFILRVDNSIQHEQYAPSPLIADMDLEGLVADRACSNIVYAYRVKNLRTREDGLIDFILPQSIARRSSQEEIDQALNSKKEGPIVFPATIHMGENQLLVDSSLKLITARLPEDMFFYQTQICGKTGSGKTVSMKYLAQYFIEKMNGAVLAINVKDTDFLLMDKPSIANHPDIQKEWDVLGESARGIKENYTIYYPATTIIYANSVNQDICVPITLDVAKIDPESLIGILQNVSELGAQAFPDIFRYWQEKERTLDSTFNSFVDWFADQFDSAGRIPTLNVRDDESTIPLHRGTYENIRRAMNSSVEFFDNKGAKSLDYDDILYEGKFSVINVTGAKGTQFGSILLRHLLKKIDNAKSNRLSKVPILVIIDEVHQFYNTDASRETLGVLDTICRTGRSKQIGVIFASQNQEDLPKGLTNVINTKIFFKSDGISKNSFSISNEEIQSLKKGYAVVNIHDLPQLRIVKFPLSFAGVI